jgi:hypothetical protein
MTGHRFCFASPTNSSQYDVLFEVATEQIAEEVFKVDEFAGEVWHVSHL